MTILYAYRAALYCEACGEKISAELTAQGKAPDDPDDEASYDSDDFPKSAIAGESDSVTFCDSGSECADPITLKSGHKIGAHIEEDLTDEGQKSLLESLARKDLDPVLVKIYTEIADAHGVTIPKKHCQNIAEMLLKDGTLPAFTSVGCYTLAYYTESGDTLCCDCAADPENEATQVDVYYEGPTQYCEACNAEIESAYGDPDAEEDICDEA